MPAPAIIERAYDALTQAMREAAAEWYADRYPQYDGTFTDWSAAQVTVRTQFKGSSLFEAGDIVLVEPTQRIELGRFATVRAWCPRSGNIVGCPPENLGAIKVMP